MVLVGLLLKHSQLPRSNGRAKAVSQKESNFQRMAGILWPYNVASPSPAKGTTSFPITLTLQAPWTYCITWGRWQSKLRGSLDLLESFLEKNNRRPLSPSHSPVLFSRGNYFHRFQLFLTMVYISVVIKPNSPDIQQSQSINTRV